MEVINGSFAVCKVADFSEIDLSRDFTFASKTDNECSLVCRSEHVPGNALEVENDWAMIRVKGQLDFGLVGILADITKSLANNDISVFAISTFDTDYILVRSKDLTKALRSLGMAKRNM